MDYNSTMNVSLHMSGGVKPSIQLTLSAKEQSALRKLGVEIVVLFGSQALGIATSSSDYDIGVLLKQPVTRIRKETYDAVYEIFTRKINRLVTIDIVFLDRVPLELQYHVAKFGIPLHELPPGRLVSFREQVMNLYADFAPIRKYFQDASLERIST